MFSPSACTLLLPTHCAPARPASSLFLTQAKCLPTAEPSCLLFSLSFWSVLSSSTPHVWLLTLKCQLLTEAFLIHQPKGPFASISLWYSFFTALNLCVCVLFSVPPWQWKLHKSRDPHLFCSYYIPNTWHQLDAQYIFVEWRNKRMVAFWFQGLLTVTHPFWLLLAIPNPINLPTLGLQWVPKCRRWSGVGQTWRSFRSLPSKSFFFLECSKTILFKPQISHRTPT